MTLGRNLRAAREAKGYSLRDAQALTRVSIATISRAERGVGTIHVHALASLAKCYGVSIEDLLDFDIPEMTTKEAEAFLVARGHNLDKLRSEINALIDELQAETKSVLAARLGASDEQ
jgi:transcriptional regulator with XRE-family HTH domain